MSYDSNMTDDTKKTDVSIRSDKATGIASTAHGANIDALGFNITLIAEKEPTRAAHLIKEYNELKDITPDTPAKPDEDFGLAQEQVKEIMEGLDG